MGKRISTQGQWAGQGCGLTARDQLAPDGGLRVREGRELQGKVEDVRHSLAMDKFTFFTGTPRAGRRQSRHQEQRKELHQNSTLQVDFEEFKNMFTFLALKVPIF